MILNHITNYDNVREEIKIMNNQYELSRREKEVLSTNLSAEIMKLQLHYNVDDTNSDIPERLQTLYSLRDKLCHERVFISSELPKTNQTTIDQLKEHIALLKNELVNIRLANILASIPRGHCPYAYYSTSKQSDRESCDDCTACKYKFSQDMRADIEKEVAEL